MEIKVGQIYEASISTDEGAKKILFQIIFYQNVVYLVNLNTGELMLTGESKGSLPKMDISKLFPLGVKLKYNSIEEMFSAIKLVTV